MNCKKLSVKNLIIIFVFLLLAIQIFETKSIAATKEKFDLSVSTLVATNKNVVISVKTKKGVKASKIVIKKGNIRKTSNKYWKKAKDITKKKKYSVKDNGTYSVKLTCKNGKSYIKTVTISNIDKTVPLASASYSVSNRIATVSVSASDNNGIAWYKFIQGWTDQTTNERWNAAINYDIGQSFQVMENGYYSILVCDGVGNKAIYQLFVEITKPLYDLDEFYNSSDIKKKSTATDSLGNSYINALQIWGDRWCVPLHYYLNGQYKYLEGDFAAESANLSRGAVLKIYADDVLIYTSNYCCAPLSLTCNYLP